MELYSGTSLQFIDDANLNRISNLLKSSFFDYYRYNPSLGEIQSWDNSLRAMSGLISHSKLDDHGILLEYQLPMTSKRLDFFITGRNPNGKDHAVIVELKQWTSTRPSEGINEVSTHLGGHSTDVLHPSVQVGQYRQYLQDSHTAFHEAPSPIDLDSCAYLHNYARDAKDAIFDPKFNQPIQTNPLFLKEDAGKLSDFLRSRLAQGHGMEVLKRVRDGRQRPSKKLMEHVASVIKGNPEYILIDAQLIAFDKVLAAVQHALRTGEKTILLVPGGPGTGKSVIALNLIAALSRLGRNAHYATGSKAFTSTLREIIGRSATVQFKYFNNYTNTPTDDIDVILCDEAHRLRSSSSDRFHPVANPKPQIDEIVNAAKVSVFLLDDRQSVRPGEVGSPQLVRDASARNRTRFTEFDPLEIQFRCSGSDGFIQWVNNTLAIQRTPNAIWNTTRESFDFRILDSPQAVEEAIRQKAAEGFSARMTAGFCWPWSEPDGNGRLVEDVLIGDYRRPWNAKPKDLCKGGYRISKDIPTSSLWAYDKRGIDQVGCIYTAQGFEFDYAGVIFGEDLIYRFDQESWVGVPAKSEDSVVKRSRDSFLELVKNTYRVLLTRGMKGCYICFVDKETERFARSRMERK
jgi:hypothetical protein